MVKTPFMHSDDEALITKRAADRLMRVVRLIFSGSPYVEAGIYAVYTEDDDPRYVDQQRAFDRFGHDLEAATRGAVQGNALFKNALSASSLFAKPPIVLTEKPDQA